MTRQPKRKLGRPFLYTEKMTKSIIALDPKSRKRALKLGDGNLSVGVRKALNK